ncbi:MAG: putative hydantoinase, partial [Thermomicrobiales bacterium]|nr:putative hydantoinase [Thermomicrobiales bacterium]
GFARGVLLLEGSGPDAGRALRIDFQNENLIARTDEGEILAVVPDLICLVDEDSAEPITTEIVRYGLRVVVLGIPAPEMLKTPESLAVVGPAAFGYADVPYVPLPGVFGQAN